MRNHLSREQKAGHGKNPTHICHSVWIPLLCYLTRNEKYITRNSSHTTPSLACRKLPFSSFLLNNPGTIATRQKIYELQLNWTPQPNYTKRWCSKIREIYILDLGVLFCFISVTSISYQANLTLKSEIKALPRHHKENPVVSTPFTLSFHYNIHEVLHSLSWT